MAPYISAVEETVICGRISGVALTAKQGHVRNMSVIEEPVKPKASIAKVIQKRINMARKGPYGLLPALCQTYGGR